MFSILAWLDGLQPASPLPLIAADKTLYIVYYLALMHYLHSTAGHALAQFRPLLQASDSEFARGALLASGVGLLLMVASLRFTPADAVLVGFASALLLPLAIWLLQQLRMGWLPGV